MKKSLRYAVVFAVVLFTGSAIYVPPAQAVGYDNWYIYYDASFAEIGWWNRNCSGQISSSGSQTGAWKEWTLNECFPPGGSSSTYFQYCSGEWVEVPYLGANAC